MPETLLKKMYESLCICGAEFCRPSVLLPGTEREPVQNKPGAVASFGFSKDIPGDSYFHPESGGNAPYYPPERHPSHVEMIYPVYGPVDFLVNNEWKHIEDHRVRILLRNTIHTERHCGGEEYLLFWLTCLPGSLTLHRTTYSREKGYGQSACRIAISPPTAYSLWTCGAETPVDEPHYFSLLVQCLDDAVHRNLAVNTTADYRFSVMNQIRRYLDENYTQPVMLEDLAEMAHCSTIHLNRVFSEMFGDTVHRYLLDLRIEEAKRLLLSGMPPGMAAQNSGFTDARYFSRIFRQKTGKAPSAFCKKDAGPQ